MKALLKVLFLPFILSVLLPSVSAETLNLKEAVNIALKESPLIRAYRWGIISQEEDLQIAKSHLYPVLSLEERFMRTDNPTYTFMAKLNQERFAQADFLIESLNNPDPVSDFQTSLRFEQPLFVPKIYESINLAKGELGAKKAEYEQLKEDVVLSVVSSYLMTLTAKEYLSVALKGLEDAKEHRRLAQLKYDSGTGLYSDLLRTEVSVKDAEAKIAQAESSIDIARRRLGLVLGRTAPVDVSDYHLSPQLNSPDFYLDAAGERYDLQAMQQRYENSLGAINLEKSAFLPEIGMGGSYQFNDHNTPFGSEGRSYSLSVFLRWNFPDTALRHRIRKAGAEAQKAKEGLSGLENEINFRVHSSYSRVLEHEKKLALSKAALKSAEEALRLVRVRYENGLAPIVDLIDTRLMLDLARTKVIKTENEYHKSIADLYYQSGILLKAMKNQGGIK